MLNASMSSLRKHAGDDDTFFDDSGETKYLWCRHENFGEEGCDAIYIWTKSYFDDKGHVSDQGSDFLGLTLDGKGEEICVYDGTFHKTIGQAITALGFDEHSESLWSGDIFGSDDGGDIAVLINFVKKHPRFKHCPEME